MFYMEQKSRIKQNVQNRAKYQELTKMFKMEQYG